MKRLIWLIGTFAIGTVIAVGSWLAVRDILPGSVLAAQPPVTAKNPTNNFNDNEAPPHTSESGQPKTFIGSLRKLIDDTPELGDEFKEHGETLDQAEQEFLRIKRQNEKAWKDVNRHPPISIPQSPNFVVIDMPGLGFADLATFSQQVEPGQDIDYLARSGLVFTHYYTASPNPATNSCALLTGLHSGRTRIRGEAPAVPLALDDITVAESLWRAGYSTSMIGQWRLGGARTSGAPTRQGFEEAWFTDAFAADGDLVVWNNDKQAEGKDQPADLAEFHDSMFNRAVGFFDRHRGQPVFLYLSLPADDANASSNLEKIGKQLTNLNSAVEAMNLRRETYFFLAGSAGKNIPASETPPEVALVESDLAQPSEPAANVPPEPMPPVASPMKIIPGAKAPDSGAKPPEARPASTTEVIETEFPPSTTPAASQQPVASTDATEQIPPPPSDDQQSENASDAVATENTKVAQHTGMMNSEQLRTKTAREVAGLRGELGDLYEGGLRAPLIVWTTHRPLGDVRDDVVAAWDLLPTLAGLSYAQFVPTNINGVPFSDRLRVRGDTNNLPLHPALYWETHHAGFQRAFLYGKWKLVQIGEDGPIALYNLANDPDETRDVSEQQSELVEKLAPLLDRVRSKSRHWPRAAEEPARK